MIVGGRVIIKCFFSFRGRSCNQMLLLGIKFWVQVFGWGLLQRQRVCWFISLSVLLDQIAIGVGLAESASYDRLSNVWELEVQCTYVLDWELVWLIHPQKGWVSQEPQAVPAAVPTVQVTQKNDEMYSAGLSQNMITEEGTYPFPSWNPQQKRLIKSKDKPLEAQELMKVLEEIQQHLQDPSSVLRFHSMKKLPQDSELKADAVFPWMLFLISGDQNHLNMSLLVLQAPATSRTKMLQMSWKSPPLVAMRECSLKQLRNNI